MANPRKNLTPKRYCAVSAPLHHPFQNIRITMGNPGVPMMLDSWLQSQIERGLVKEIIETVKPTEMF